MGIISMIANRKKQFKEMTVQRRKEQAIKDTERLRAERLRQQEIAKVEGARMKERQAVEKLKAYNKKARGPNKMQRFGKGLAKVIDKGKSDLKEAKSQGLFKGFNRENSMFQPSGKFETGGQGLQFGKEVPKKKEKGKTTTIIIKQ